MPRAQRFMLKDAYCYFDGMNTASVRADRMYCLLGREQSGVPTQRGSMLREHDGETAKRQHHSDCAEAT